MPSKKSRIRFYADENIPITTITYLKAKGVSIVHAFDYDFIAKPDKEHVQKSKALERVLVSLDKVIKYVTPSFAKNSLIRATSDTLTRDRGGEIIKKVLK